MKVRLVEDNPLVREQVTRTVQAIPDPRVVKVAGTEPRASEWLSAHPAAPGR